VTRLDIHYREAVDRVLFYVPRRCCLSIVEQARNRFGFVLLLMLVAAEGCIALHPSPTRDFLVTNQAVHCWAIPKPGLRRDDGAQRALHRQKHVGKGF
jgi:hypothetical protein